MPGVLHTPGAVGAPEQGPGSGDAGHHCQAQGEPWPGRDSGVRAPRFGEVALSADEVRHGFAVGVFG